MEARPQGSVETPWGPSHSLRDRRLRPGPGADREEVARSQRERLFGAMVASVTERGYAETTLDNLVEISGVSRRTLYNLFDDKQACFRAAIELLLAAALERTSVQGTSEISWEDLTRVRFKAFIDLVSKEPAATKMALIESHIAGPEARRPVDAAVELWEQVMARRFAESPDRAGMPPEAIGAFVGGTLEIVRDRIGRGREAELPALIGEYAELLLSYRAPTQPLRSAPRGRISPGESIDSPDHRDRAIRALAVVSTEKGYSEVTVTDVVSRAAMSPGTFYANFSGKDDLMAAAVESAGAQILAVAIPAFRRHEDWRQGTRSAIGAVFNLLASRPGLARLFLLDIYAAGPRALQLRDETLRPLRALLPEPEPSPPTAPPPVAPWAIAAGAYALAYRQLLKDEVDSLRGLTPICTYLALAPYTGAEEASRIANDSGRQRRSVAAELQLFDETPSWPTKRRVMAFLHARPSSAAEVSQALGVPIETVRSHLAELEGEELVAATPESEGEDTVYDSTMRNFDEAQWERLSMEERVATSTRILNLMFGEAEEALESGNFEARPERHLSRVAGTVDDEGFRRLAALHDETLRTAMQIFQEASDRLKASGEKGQLARSSQALFEAPEMTSD